MRFFFLSENPPQKFIYVHGNETAFPCLSENPENYRFLLLVFFWLTLTCLVGHHLQCTLTPSDMSANFLSMLTLQKESMTRCHSASKHFPRYHTGLEDGEKNCLQGKKMHLLSEPAF